MVQPSSKGMKKCLKKKNNNFTSVQSIDFAVMEAKKKMRSIMWLQTKIIWKGSPSTRKMACATILGKGGETCAGKLCVCVWGWVGGHPISSAYHSQTNGQDVRFNQTLLKVFENWSMKSKLTGTSILIQIQSCLLTIHLGRIVQNTHHCTSCKPPSQLTY